MRDKIIYLLGQYEAIIEVLEEDRRNDGVTISNAYRTAKIGVYAKVVEDLKAVLEAGEEE